MAEEEKVEATPARAAPPPQSGQKPILFIVLLVVNMAFLGAVVMMLYTGNKKQAERPTIDNVIQGEIDAQKHDAAQDEEFIGKLIPLETFMVNLAGGRGRKVARITMEFEIDNLDVEVEVDKRKPQIRDMIIILLSSKKYELLSTREGKEAFRDEIRDTLNKFLVKGKVNQVYFTEFILN